MHQLDTNHTNAITLNTENNCSSPLKEEANHDAPLSYEENITQSLETNAPSMKMNNVNTSFPDTACFAPEEINGMTSSYKENGISKESLLSDEIDSSSSNVHDKLPVNVPSHEITPDTSQNNKKNKCIGQQTFN